MHLSTENTDKSVILTKVKKISDKPHTPEGYIQLNTLSWFPNNTYQGIKIYELTPYHLKVNGQIFENIWQFAKLYPKVYAQNQVYNGVTQWQWPSENHVISGVLQPEYLKWRESGMNCPYPVRYPNGYNHRKECICHLWNINGEFKSLKYIEARKEIYCKLYRQSVKETSAFKEILKYPKLQLIDVDVPQGDTIVTQENYDKYLNDTSQAFGHTWSLAALLLNLRV